MFADTPVDATSSALIYSILESATATNHKPLHHMGSVMAEMPDAKSIEDHEALRP